MHLILEIFLGWWGNVLAVRKRQLVYLMSNVEQLGGSECRLWDILSGLREIIYCPLIFPAKNRVAAPLLCEPFVEHKAARFGNQEAIF